MTYRFHDPKALMVIRELCMVAVSQEPGEVDRLVPIAQHAEGLAANPRILVSVLHCLAVEAVESITEVARAKFGGNLTSAQIRVAIYEYYTAQIELATEERR